MKRTVVLIMVAALAMTANAALWTEDFSSTTWYEDVGDPYADGDVYFGDIGDYGNWGGVVGTLVVDDHLRLNGNNNNSTRSAGTILSAETFGSATDLTLQFDIIDIDNHGDTKVFVEIWETKGGYMDLMAAASTTGGAPEVKTWASAYIQRLGGAVYTNLMGVDGTTQTIDFTRIDTTSDIVVMFGGHKTADWFNSSDIDNVAITPEPATMLLLSLGSLVVLKRKK